MILHRDLVRLEKALLDLYAPGLEAENYAGRAFRLVNALFESELLGLIVRDAAGATLDIALDRLMPGLAQVGEGFSRLAPKYPWFRADPAVHGGRLHCRSDFCSDRQFRDLDIHAEVYRAWGHEHFMSMHVHNEGEGEGKGRVVFFGFNRGRRDFSARERALAALARPHLSAARNLARALSAGKVRPVTPALLARRGFTPREAEALYWLTEGKSNVEIAAILRIGLPTVKGYLTAIFDKTGAGNRHAAVLHALELARRAGENDPGHARTGPFLSLPYHLSPTKVG